MAGININTFRTDAQKIGFDQVRADATLRMREDGKGIATSKWERFKVGFVDLFRSASTIAGMKNAVSKSFVEAMRSEGFSGGAVSINKPLSARQFRSAISDFSRVQHLAKESAQKATNTANRQALLKDFSAGHVDCVKITQNMINLFNQGYKDAARDEAGMRDFSNMFGADLKDMGIGDLKKLNDALAENTFFEGMAQCTLPLAFHFESEPDKNKKWTMNIVAGGKLFEAAANMAEMGRMVGSLRTSVFEALRSKGEDPLQQLDDKHFEFHKNISEKAIAEGFVRNGNMLLKSPDLESILGPAKTEFTPHQYSPGHILLASVACGGDIGKAMEKLGEFSEQVLSAQRSGAPTPSWSDLLGRMAEQTNPGTVSWH